jgi:hypothetical protein
MNVPKSSQVDTRYLLDAMADQSGFEICWVLDCREGGLRQTGPRGIAFIFE